VKVVNLRFYDENLHKEMKFQALKEDTSLQALIIKACQEYLQKSKLEEKECKK
jgi:predicted HicB family RNase H-like nuclease